MLGEEEEEDEEEAVEFEGDSVKRCAMVMDQGAAEAAPLHGRLLRLALVGTKVSVDRIQTAELTKEAPLWLFPARAPPSARLPSADADKATPEHEENSERESSMKKETHSNSAASCA